MGRVKVSKLNKLLTSWPSATVTVCSWLYKKGYPYQLLDRYRLSHWINSVGNGAVVRAGDKISWEGGIYAIQEQLGLTIHPGGKTALQMHGFAHFLPLAKKMSVHLFGAPTEKLPVWFKTYDWGVTIRFRAVNLFSDQKIALTEIETGAFSIKVSAPERGALELLSLVPQEQTFEEAKLLMEGLAMLRPKVVQTLLEQCGSIKAKRLFLFLADELNHQWLKKLDLSKVDLGKGKRVIVKGGHFNSKYLISVPGPRPTPQTEGGP